MKIIKILLLILLIPFNAFGWGTLCQQDAGSTTPAGECYTITEDNVSTYFASQYDGDSWGESLTIENTGDAYRWSLWMKMTAGGGANVECRLGTTTNLSSTYLLTETLAVSGTSVSKYDFVFSPTTELTTGTYYVMCKNDNASFANRIDIQRDTGNSDYYTGGSSYACNQCSLDGMGEDDNSDFDFEFSYGACP